MITTEQIDQILKQANADPELRAINDLRNARMILEQVLNYTDDLVKKHPGDALVDMIFRQVIQSLLTVQNAEGLIAKYRQNNVDKLPIAGDIYDAATYTRERMSLMIAFLGGYKIQCKRRDVIPEADWVDTEEPSWDFLHYDYRVKP